MDMKRAICILLSTLLLAGCGAAPAETTKSTENPVTTTEATTAPVEERTYNILFIGNSYTSFHDMPYIYFAPIARECGVKVQVTTILKGGHNLGKFADPSDLYGMQVNSALSVNGKFDYVILQDMSTQCLADPEAFDTGIRTLAEKIRAVGAQPILYATWGRQAGQKTLAKYSLTNQTMTYKVADAYATIGKELDIPVMHVGLAFYEVNTNSQINLYDADLHHPSPNGSYLAAMTLFCGIFDVDPVTAPFSGPMSPEDDAIVRAAVANALKNPQIPEMP